MQEIRLLRKKLQTKKSELVSSTYETANRNAQSFLSLIQSDPMLSKVINKVDIGKYDWVAWETSLNGGGLGGRSEYDIPVDDDKAARFCYELLDRHKDSIWSIAHNFYPGTNNITDHVRKFLDIFVPPLYNYLDEQLQEAEIMISPVDITKDIMETTEKNEEYEPVVVRLNDAYKKLYVAKTNDDYIAISNICRSVLVDFASQTYKSNYLPKDTEAPKNDDAKAKLKYTYKALQKDKESNFEAGRWKMIDGLWQMISSNIHRKNILKSEIEECVLLTYLTIKIFIELSSDANNNN